MQFPVPHAIPVGPLVNYGYSNEVVLLSRLTVPKDAKLSLLDYRLFELGKAEVPLAALSAASPALLSALALDQTAPTALRLPAAEGAAAVNAITPGELATIYRAHVMPADPQASDRHAGETFARCGVRSATSLKRASG